MHGINLSHDKQSEHGAEQATYLLEKPGINVAIVHLLILPVTALLLLLSASNWFWAPLISSATFALFGCSTQLRPNVSELLSPRASIYWLGFVTLVLVPWLILLTGPFRGQLPDLPPPQFINGGTLLSTLFFAGLAGTYIFTSRRLKTPKPLSRQPQSRIGLGAIVICLALGTIGVAAKLTVAGGLTAYTLGDRSSLVASGGSGLLTLAWSFFPPFMTIGALLIWNNSLLSGRRGPFRLLGLTILGVVPMLTYSYNRAAAVTTLLFILTTASRYYNLRISVRGSLILLLSTVLLIGYWFGNIRSQILNNRETTTGFTDFIQSYFGGPQYVGFGLSHQNPTQGLATFLSSILAVIPIVGKSFRDSSGSAAYNLLIYPDGAARDQVLPAPLEAYWTFWLPGVLILAGVIGISIAYLQRSWAFANSPLILFYLSFTGAWLAASQFLSVSIVAQVFLYFGLPGLLVSILLRRRHSKKTNIQEWDGVVA